MRYILGILIIVFASGCADTGEKKRDLIAEALNKDLQHIRALRPQARDLLPEELSDQEVTVIAHFLIYRSEFNCRLISEYREASEVLGCVLPEATSKAALW